MAKFLKSVSVILPCFNHERFLRERIGSVLAQLSTDDEIIFLDDASIDGSVALARKLLSAATCPVRFILNTSNSGSPFAQWNKGMLSAQKEWIWIAETDDCCAPNFLRRLLEVAEREKSHLIFAQSRIIDENGNRLSSDLHRMEALYPGVFSRDFTMDGREMIKNYLIHCNSIPNASGVIFNRKVLKYAGLANKSMGFTGDWHFWIRSLERCRISFISEELNYFRSHSGTTRQKNCLLKRRAEALACTFLGIKVVLQSPNTIPGDENTITLSDFQRFRNLVGMGNYFYYTMFLIAPRFDQFFLFFQHYKIINGVPKIDNFLKAQMVMLSAYFSIKYRLWPTLKRGIASAMQLI